MLADRFRVTGQLGAGAFGTVYAAEDQKRQTRVAIKLLTRISGNTIYRFKQEFRALADLHHPNLVRLFQLFSQGENWLFSMELLDGQRFDQYVLGDSVVEVSEETISDSDAVVVNRPRSPRKPNVDRLRDGLAQLVAGIRVLHAHGVLHRDLKPANVLVTAEGRVVLLDFGLAVRSDADAQTSVLGALMGTPTYMAPEQAMGRAVAEATDWYALGIMLYEALFGSLPFSGTVQDILAAKLAVDTWRWPVTYSGTEDLVELCKQLLRPEPERRPDGAAIAQRVGATAAALVGTVPSAGGSLLGRDGELSRLREALRAAREKGCAQLVRVRGHSGIGKSALVTAFLDSLGPDAVVLQGRCFDRESVPYKALDGVVDALTRYVRRRSMEEARLLLPRDARALCRIFPVFGRLPLFANQPERERLSLREERRRGFLALRELLARISDRRQLVLSIDDLQWGDGDSLQPLQEILAPPDAPCLLLILAYRAEDASSSSLLGCVEEPDFLGLDGSSSTIDVVGLSKEHAIELATRLLPAGETHLASELAEESGGSPFLLAELVRAHKTGKRDRPSLSLHGVMKARFEHLSEPARRLLEVIAVAGRPLPREVAYRAAGLEGEATEPAADELVRERLLRHAASEESLFETFHDRVRETVVEFLAEDVLKQHHRSVAKALEGGMHEDFEATAEHYRLAGEIDRARPATVHAAQRAADALAFGRAAELYAAAREGAASEERRLLTVELARMLVYAGRGRPAAQAYLEALKVAAPRDESELLRLAADQLLRAGAIQEGLALCKQLLADHGLSYPQSTKRALASMLWQRARLALRGHDFVERTPGSDDRDAVMKTDLCWTLGSCLSPMDVVRSADFQTRHLRFALELGDPYRVARGLALEAAILAVQGGKALQKAEAIGARAVAIAQRIDHPHALGWAHISLAVTDWCAARWRSALARSKEAGSLLRKRSPESANEVGLLEIWFKNRSLFLLGDLPEFVAEARASDEQASIREDPLTLVTSRSVGIANVLLIEGKPQEARAMSAEGIANWDSVDGWKAQHQEDLRVQTLCDIYEGKADDAVRRSAKTWPVQRRSFVLRMESERIQSFYLFALAAIHARDVGAYSRWHKKLAAHAHPWAKALTLASAAAVLASTNAEAAMKLYGRAIIQFETLDMAVYAMAARRRMGELVGGEQGRTMVRDVDDALAKRGVAEPAIWARLLVS